MVQPPRNSHVFLFCTMHERLRIVGNQESEWWARSSRNPGRLPSESAGPAAASRAAAVGRFLIRNGRGQGRPAKTSTADVLPTLVCLGITDRHISADAKSVARISQADFDTYLDEDDEPTLKGLLRFAEHTRIGQPYPRGKPIFALANMQR
jgi:hypothetical protein